MFYVSVSRKPFDSLHWFNRVHTNGITCNIPWKSTTVSNVCGLKQRRDRCSGLPTIAPGDGLNELRESVSIPLTWLANRTVAFLTAGQSRRVLKILVHSWWPRRGNFGPSSQTDLKKRLLSRGYCSLMLMNSVLKPALLC